MEVNMNLFLHEIKMYWRSLLYWSLGMIAMIGGGMIEFSGYYNSDSQVIAQFMDKFPKAFMALFGMVNLDITSLAGYYGILHLYLVIMGAVYAIILGAGILSKEERDKTVEFLMSKPVARSWVLFQKFLAGFVYILGFVAVDVFISLIFVAQAAPKENITNQMLLLSLSMILIMLAFFCVAFGLSAAMRDNRKSSGIMISFVSANYLISVYMDLVSNSDWLRPFVLFKYFPTDVIFKTMALDIQYVGFSLIWIIVGLGVAFIGFQKRDMRI
ncbi:MAG: hypothetical protein E4G74_04220 [Erysipelotrichales bacterium]|nr:MAG: hypothetical protein E4G74_04220 [Erysipelotrichales bacterium]